MNYNFNLLQYDYTICPSDWGMENANAIFYRMYYIFGGTAYFKMDGLTIPLVQGHFYILPLMSAYTLWQEEKNPLEVLWYHVEMKEEYYGRLEDIEIKEESALFYLLKAMQALLGKPEHHLMITRLFDEFLHILHVGHSFLTIQSRRMQKIVAYIDVHLSKEITVASMAQYVGMERSYFSRRFKEVFNLPPNQYLYAKRMSEAAKMLLNGQRVADVARNVGYSDEKAFSRAFKHYMEISPSQFKKSHIEQP